MGEESIQGALVDSLAADFVARRRRGETPTIEEYAQRHPEAAEAIRQLFPIVPIHRLNETPTDYATLVDVTCDSDGKIDKFVSRRAPQNFLKLHCPIASFTVPTLFVLVIPTGP